MILLPAAKRLLHYIEHVDEDAVLMGLVESDHPIPIALCNWMAAACAATGTSETVVRHALGETRAPWHAVGVAVATHCGEILRMIGVTDGLTAGDAMTRIIGLYPTALTSLAPHGGGGAHILTLHVVNGTAGNRVTLTRRAWELSSAAPLGADPCGFFVPGNMLSRQ